MRADYSCESLFCCKSAHPRLRGVTSRLRSPQDFTQISAARAPLSVPRITPFVTVCMFLSRYRQTGNSGVLKRSIAFQPTKAPLETGIPRFADVTNPLLEGTLRPSSSRIASWTSVSVSRIDNLFVKFDPGHSRHVDVGNQAIGVGE